MGRKPCCSRQGMKKGAWTELEDKILRDYIKLHGQGNWNNIPKLAGLKRCGKSCRLRWVNYLRPDIKRGNISSEEEELIIRMHKLLGNRWSLIAGRLPNRTDNEIKNYWNTILRKQLEPQLSSKIGRINRKLTDEKGPKQSLEPKKYVESTLQAMPLPMQPIRPKAFRLISKIHTSIGSDDEECKDSNEEMKIAHQSTIDEAPTQPVADLNTVDSCYSFDVPQINDNTIGTTSTDHNHSSPIFDEQGLENWNNCYDSIFTEFIATTVEDDLGVSDFGSLATFLGLD